MLPCIESPLASVWKNLFLLGSNCMHFISIRKYQHVVFLCLEDQEGRQRSDPRTKTSGRLLPCKSRWSIFGERRKGWCLAPVSVPHTSGYCSAKLPVPTHVSFMRVHMGWLQPLSLASQYKSGLKQGTRFFSYRSTGRHHHTRAHKMYANWWCFPDIYVKINL